MLRDSWSFKGKQEVKRVTKKYACDVPNCGKEPTEAVAISLSINGVVSSGLTEKIVDKAPEFEIHACSEHEEEVIERAKAIKQYLLTGEILEPR